MHCQTKTSWNKSAKGLGILRLLPCGGLGHISSHLEAVRSALSLIISGHLPFPRGSDLYPFSTAEHSLVLCSLHEHQGYRERPRGKGLPYLVSFNVHFSLTPHSLVGGGLPINPDEQLSITIRWISSSSESFKMSPISRTCQGCAKSKVRCIRNAENPHVCNRSDGLKKNWIEDHGADESVAAYALEKSVSIDRMAAASMALKKIGMRLSNLSHQTHNT